MKPRLAVLLFLIVAAPLALLAAMGALLMREEAAIQRNRSRQLLEGLLAEIDGQIARLLEDRRREGLKLASAASLDPEALRELARSQPRIRQFFVLAPDGKIAFPSAMFGLTGDEERFLERIGPIEQSGELAQLSGAARQSPAQQQQMGGMANGPASQLNSGGRGSTSASNVAPPYQNAYIPPSVPPAAAGKQGEAAESFASGWQAWYWGTGTHLIFWQRRPDGTVVGAELDRARLLSDVINLLPATAPGGAEPSLQGRIALRGANDEPLYQWGSYEPGPKDYATAIRQLSPPLQSWRLTETVPPETLAATGRSFLFSIAAGLTGSAAMLILLAGWFFRESSREMREAGQRVNFVNQVSHELKTPLTNIRMYAELLESRIEGTEAGGDPKSSQYLDVIASESRRLTRLINNVLTLGRASRQGLVLHPQPRSADAVVAAAAEHYRPALERKGLAIELDLDGGPEAMLDADAIEQILGNLLSNVEKYGGQAGRVRIASRRDGKAIAIAVEDEGPGIPPGEEEKIFLPFYRVSNRLSDGVSGTGIGLSIARDLARLHGGDLTLAKSGRGARFDLRIAPLDPPKGETA